MKGNRTYIARVAGCLTACLSLTAAAAPTVEFRLDAASALEDTGTVPVEVVLSEEAATDVTVTLKVNGGSATEGDDFSVGTLTRTIPAGAKSVSFSVSIVDDPDGEENERVVLGIDSIAGAEPGMRRAHTLTIIDNDGIGGGRPLLAKLERGRLRIPENVSPAIFAVVLNEPPVQLTSVEYVVEPLTAMDGEDYTTAKTSGTLLFPIGVTRADIFVQIIDDERAETNETFRVRLTNVTGAGFGVVTGATCTIEDEDIPEVTLQPGTGVHNEQDGSFSVEVVMDRPSDYDVKVEWRLSGTAQESVDYIGPAKKTVTFAEDVTTNRLTFSIVDDDVAEDEESFILDLLSVDKGYLGTAVRHEHLIIDNDAAAPEIEFGIFNEPKEQTLWLSSNGTTVKENDGEAVLKVRLSRTNALPITVNFVVRDGEAVRGSDYELGPGALSLTFPPGEDERELVVEILDDTEVEPDEHFSVEMTNAVNARVKRGVLNCWIWDDDSSDVINEYLYQITTNSVEPGRDLVVLGSKDPSIKLRGLALDPNGNRYLTDHGSTTGSGGGSIVMWPTGSPSIVRLQRGLTKPEDIEIAPDGRSLLYVSGDGHVRSYTFGALIEIEGLPKGSEAAALVYALTDMGPITAEYLSEGYYHVPNLLIEGQTSSSIDVVVELHGSIEKTFYDVGIYYPGEFEMKGERMLHLKY